MRLLLDTNAIIWWDSKSSKLSKKAEDARRSRAQPRIQNLNSL